MAVFNTFTFDGENSLDYGVYITGEAVYNAPERAVEMVSIPGKNGALALDQGRFENIEVTYPAGTFGVQQAEFAGRMRSMRNMLASRYNYVRLTDSYHPDEYRLGLYKSGLEATPVAMSSAGEFDITFNCKPQRFLTSGEEPVDTSELGGEVTTDTEPYLFRRSGGGNIGHDFDAEIDKIIGGTVAWNQLVQNISSSYWETNGNGTATYSYNVATFTASARNAMLIGSSTNRPNPPTGHKVLYGADIKTASATSNAIRLRINGGTYLYAEPTTDWQNLSHIVSWDSSLSAVCGVRDVRSENWDAVQIKNPTFIDLTALFGSAEIADYVYSLEQTTSGSGVAWLKSHGFLTKDYYAYNEGSLLSVKTSEHRTTGKNLLFITASSETKNGITMTINADGSIKLNGTATAYTFFNLNVVNSNTLSIPVGTYYANGGIHDVVYRVYVDGSRVLDNTAIVDREFTVPSGATLSYLRIDISTGKTFNDETFYPMIRLASVSDATFEPYHINSYPLDSDLELRGLFKLDANNNLYADGDVYESSGAVTRKYGIRAYQSGDESLTDAITDGTNTVYKLTTPTTETAEPYQRIQIVDNNGTEEYVDTRDVPVPVGHETRYGMSQLILTNPTEFPSKPLLEVTGVGTFWLGDTLFTITGTAGQTIYIDCETGEAWKNTGGIITPANGLVTLNRLDFPELDPGDTPVMYGTGITKVVVTPRWWII